MSEKFTVGLVQMRSGADAEENLSRAAAKIREAAARSAQIICLPELFRSPYFCREENADLFALAESIPGPTTEALAAVATVTPPVGMNLFVISRYTGTRPEVIFKGVLPHIVAHVFAIILFVAFPAIILWLPSTMKN